MVSVKNTLERLLIDSRLQGYVANWTGELWGQQSSFLIDRLLGSKGQKWRQKSCREFLPLASTTVPNIAARFSLKERTLTDLFARPPLRGENRTAAHSKGSKPLPCSSVLRSTDLLLLLRWISHKVFVVFRIAMWCAGNDQLSL